MDIEEWKPEPRAAVQAPKPVGKWRTILSYSLAFTGLFSLCLAVLGRVELAGYVEQHFPKKPPITADRAAEGPMPDVAVASIVRSTPNPDVATHPLPEKPAEQTPRRPRPLPTSAPVRLPEAIPPTVDRPQP